MYVEIINVFNDYVGTKFYGNLTANQYNGAFKIGALTNLIAKRTPHYLENNFFVNLFFDIVIRS